MLLTISSTSDRASLGRAGGRCGGGLPAGRQQDTQVVAVGHGRQALEHVGQPDLGVVPVALRAFDHGVNDGGALAGGFAAHEQPVLLFMRTCA
jgi:hypothetical protein